MDEMCASWVGGIVLSTNDYFQKTSLYMVCSLFRREVLIDRVESPVIDPVLGRSTLTVRSVMRDFHKTGHLMVTGRSLELCDIGHATSVFNY